MLMKREDALKLLDLKEGKTVNANDVFYDFAQCKQ